MERSPLHQFGSRGEWWVVVQLLLMLAVGASATLAPPSPSIGESLARAGAVLLIAGVALAVMGAASLGDNLTPYPKPRDGARLVTSGAYAIVRHPIYTALVAIAFGWGLASRRLPTIAAAFALLILFDLKSRREERWLVERFPEYAEYQRRVRKLIPFLY